MDWKRWLKNFNLRGAKARHAARHYNADMDVSRPLRRGILVIAIGLGGFILWAATAPLDQGIVTQGVVTVKSNRKSVQHLRGGIVKEILVHGGDKVSQNTPLVLLDDTQAKAEVDQIKGQYLAFRAIESRLLAERARRDALEFAPEVLAAAEHSNLAEQLALQRELFDTRRKSLADEIAIYQENIAGLAEQLEGQRQLEAGKVKQISLLNEQLRSMQALQGKGYVARAELFDLERALANLTGSHGEGLGNIARLQKNIGELKLKIHAAEQDYLKEVETQIQDVQRQLADLKERLTAAQDNLAHTVIAAPADGYVMDIKVHTVGGVITPGEQIMSVVPEGDVLVLDVRVLPQDIDKVSVGQAADVRLTAFNRNTTPVVQGSVTTVSADRLVEERTGLPYYSARVALAEGWQEKIGGNLQLQPGMPADVIIKTGERTLMVYLLKPLFDRFARSLKEE